MDDSASFYFFHFCLTNGIMNTMKNETIQMDKAGRVVLPKPLREQFNLLPGDKLRLSVEGNGFRLEPADAGGELVRKGSVLVFTGGFPEPITTAQVNKLIEQDDVEVRMKQWLVGRACCAESVRYPIMRNSTWGCGAP